MSDSGSLRPRHSAPSGESIRILIDQGRIAEVGNYVELVQQGGLFRELVLSAENGLRSPLPEIAAQSSMVRSA